VTPKAVLPMRDCEPYSIDRDARQIGPAGKRKMAFLSEFVTAMLVLQVVTLVLLAIVLTAQAIHRSVLTLVQRVSGQEPNPEH